MYTLKLFILPSFEVSFEVLGKLMKAGELEVYNLSTKSRLPASVLPRRKLQDVINEIKD